MTDHNTHVQPEREGHCAVCSCGWERWAPTAAKCHEYARQHRPRKESA